MGCGGPEADAPGAEADASAIVAGTPQEFSGGSWEVQHADSTALWIALDIVDEETVWAAGTEGRVARTVNGGAGWEIHRVPGADSLQFRDVHAFSASRAVVLSIGNGTDSRIYETTDGGASWSRQFLNEDPNAFFDCLSFWDEERGFAFSDSHEGEFTLIRTLDGGATWSRIDPARVPDARPGEGAFASSGTCVVTRPGGLGWFVTGASGVDTRVISTRDYGETWTEVVTPIASNSGTSGITSLAFLDDRTGAAFGGDFSLADSILANLALTSDGGETWSPAGPVPLGGAPFAGTFVPAAPGPTLVAVAPTGSAFSVDGGANWTVIDERSYWTVAFHAPTVGWAAGPGHISRFVASR
jgi:photosystem II stability/assembly factor-like uncharacterized protein